jgi:hypothetical protein
LRCLVCDGTHGFVVDSKISGSTCDRGNRKSNAINDPDQAISKESQASHTEMGGLDENQKTGDGTARHPIDILKQTEYM